MPPLELNKEIKKGVREFVTMKCFESEKLCLKLCLADVEVVLVRLSLSDNVSWFGQLFNIKLTLKKTSRCVEFP